LLLIQNSNQTLCFLYSLQNHQGQIIGCRDNPDSNRQRHIQPCSRSGAANIYIYPQHLSLCSNPLQDYAQGVNEPVVILFDGVCNLCNGVVQFVIARDPQARFKFASQQSEVGCEIMRQYNLPEMTSVVLIRDGQALLKSDAVLEIARLLPAPWSWAVAFKIVPRALRDFVYDLVARSRYSIFGKREVCWLPTPELRTRFLDL
jgi:predicted DCC family thiol-disulfide oxidoreductase YuxK